MSRLRSIAPLALCAALAGCAATASSTSGPPTVSSTTSRGAPRRHHQHRSARRRAPQRRVTPVSHGLPSSSASSHVVQPQPPAGSCHTRGAGALALPDRRCTPGAIDPAVTQANLFQTICRSGYSKSVRPSESITEPEKLASMAAYGDSDSARDYEYDHLVSLELGGAPNDPRNLWPEPGGSPNVKDKLEDRLHALVCDGKLALRSAQAQIAGDWFKAYGRYVRPTL